MFKKLLKNIACAASLMIAGSFAANAGLLIQEIEVDEGFGDGYQYAGYVAIDLDLFDEFGEAMEWTAFNLYGFDMLTEAQADLVDPLDPYLFFGGFLAVINQDSIWKGLEFMTFDVTDNMYGFFHFDGIVDVADPFSYVSVFDQDANGPYIFGDARFGEYSYVPEPSMFLLFLTGLAGVALRRKA